VNGAVGEGSHEYAASILDEQLCQVGKHQGLSSSRRSLNEMEEICSVGHSDSFHLTGVQSTIFELLYGALVFCQVDLRL
jgi:hypothetical protein